MEGWLHSVSRGVLPGLSGSNVLLNFISVGSFKTKVVSTDTLFCLWFPFVPWVLAWRSFHSICTHPWASFLTVAQSPVPAIILTTSSGVHLLSGYPQSRCSQCSRRALSCCVTCFLVTWPLKWRHHSGPILQVLIYFLVCLGLDISHWTSVQYGWLCVQSGRNKVIGSEPYSKQLSPKFKPRQLDSSI